MQTTIEQIYNSQKNYSTSDLVKEILNENIIVIETETVYGIAGLPIKKVNQKIFDIKQRDYKKPLPIAIANNEKLIKKISENIPNDYKNKFNKLRNAFWPGPLTIVMNAPNIDDLFVTPTNQELKTIAVRVPENKKLQSILLETGPLVLTSANISNKQSPFMSNNLASTIITIENPLSPLRSGGITKRAINDILNK